MNNCNEIAHYFAEDSKICECRQKTRYINDHKCGGELCVVCGYREKIMENPTP